MTIANASTILKSDLDAMATTALGLVQADNAHLPAGLDVNFVWPNLVTGTALTRRRAVFVAPCDMLIECVAAEAADHTASSTLTVTVVGDGALVTGDGDDGWGMTLAGTVGAGITKLSRLLFDNTRTNVGVAFESTARAFRVFPKGSTITVTVATTSIATPSQTRVCLVGREYWGRDS